MTHLIRGMLDATIDAYVKDDGRLAKEIIDANHQIETSFKKIRQSIASKMKNDAKVVTGGTWIFNGC